MIYVRTMTHQDIPGVSELLCLCYRWLGEKEGLTSQNIEFLVKCRGSIDTVRRESATEIYLVACVEAEITGMVSVKNNEITKLYVDPRWHRKGIGRILFEKAEEMIEKNGYDQIVLGAIGSSPLPFYESMGMKISGRKPCRMEQNSDREVILMEKLINKESIF